MSGSQILSTAWAWEPTVCAGCVALLLGYMELVWWATTPEKERLPLGRMSLFSLGVLILLLALISPIDTLGDTYLFSAHMLQHLLLILVVPPLLLLGLSPAVLHLVLSIPAIGRAERVLGHPGVAWLLGVGTLWAWHLPTAYDAALTDEGLHVVQHLTFLASATIFWWPVVVPAPWRRLSLPLAVLYLLAASLANSVLGILITFAPTGLYPAYLNPPDPLHILRLLRDEWGLTPATDQQIGGLLMWIPGGLAYLFGIIGVLARWYAEPEPDLLAIAPTIHARGET